MSGSRKAVNEAGMTGDDTVLELLARGPLLQGLDGLDPEWDNYLAAQRAQHSSCIEAAIAARLKDATTDSTLARRLLRIDTSHEGAWRALISAQLNAGEPSLALRAFKECEDALRRQLDVCPSAETHRLVETARGRTIVQPIRQAQPTSRAAVRSSCRRMPPQILGESPCLLAEAFAEILASSLGAPLADRALVVATPRSSTRCATSKACQRTRLPDHGFVCAAAAGVCR